RDDPPWGRWGWPGRPGAASAPTSLPRRTNSLVDVPDLLEGLRLDLEGRVRDLELVAQEPLKAAQELVGRVRAGPEDDVARQRVHPRGDAPDVEIVDGMDLGEGQDPLLDSPPIDPRGAGLEED